MNYQLTPEEREHVQPALKRLIAEYLRAILTDQTFDEDKVGRIVEDWVRRRGVDARRARDIVAAACHEGCVAYLGEQGDDNARLRLAMAHIDAEEPLPSELLASIGRFLHALYDPVATLNKGLTRAHVLEVTGVPLEDDTPRLTKIFYALFKDLELPEDRKARRGQRATRGRIGTSGAALEEVVASELGIEVPTLKKRLQAAKKG